MARQWFVEGQQVHEDGTEEYFVEGVQVNEDQQEVAGDPEGSLVGGKLIRGGLLISGRLVG